MSEEYKIKMAHAENCEQVIARFRDGDDPTGKPLKLNFASKTQRDWQEVIRSYQEAFDIYRDFNQRGEAEELFAICLIWFRLVMSLQVALPYSYCPH